MSTENTNNNASQKQTEGVKQTKKNTTRYRPRVKSQKQLLKRILIQQLRLMKRK